MHGRTTERRAHVTAAPSTRGALSCVVERDPATRAIDIAASLAPPKATVKRSRRQIGRSGAARRAVAGRLDDHRCVKQPFGNATHACRWWER